MFRKPLYLAAALFVAGSIIIPDTDAQAQCFGSLMLAPGFFEFDYLVRIAVHFGSAEDIPEYIMCGRDRLPGEEIIEFPIWFYNAHEGWTHMEFAMESNDSIVGFDPAGCICLRHESSSKNNGIFKKNVKLDSCRPLCGPDLLGLLLVRPAPGSDMTWVNFLPNAHTGRMYATDYMANSHHMFSPNHGGFVGPGHLYTCQTPICEEPNYPVTELEAVAGFGLAVRLTWIAGEGNVTVIRARNDMYPTGYGDGRLVVEMPSLPGEHKYYYDTEADQSEIIYYKAFALTKDLGGNVIDNSFVECSSVDTTFTHGFIATEESSWGSIKMMMK
jgi:hypothetical protein